MYLTGKKLPSDKLTCMASPVLMA